MAFGKRLSKDEPLTEHDVAERLDRAALRVWRIMLDVRQDPELFALVKNSRYLSNSLYELRLEIDRWYKPGFFDD